MFDDDERNDPLTALIVDSREMDRGRLAALLADRAGIDPKEGRIRFLPGVKENATNKDLTIIALLAQNALHLVNGDSPAGLTPSELSDVTGIKGGSLRPVLKRLADAGVVTKNGAGRYTVPTHSLDHIEQMLSESDE